MRNLTWRLAGNKTVVSLLECFCWHLISHVYFLFTIASYIMTPKRQELLNWNCHFLKDYFHCSFYNFFWRAYELWTEDFLLSEYGNLTVRLEARAESNPRTPVGEAGILGRDTIKHFIHNYQTTDAYVISQIPQPMERDIGIPPCLR